MKKYTSENIKVLEGLEAVRVRPGMYIGSTGTRGLHHLLWEVLDNSIDEALSGHCNTIDVTTHNDGSMSIKDNGRGIPVDKHSSGKSALEVIMTVLHAGGKFDNDNYEFSGGLHGVGISVVNALSEKLIVEVERDGNKYRQTFSKGNTLTNLEVLGQSKNHGTLIRFYPDDTIFTETEFNPNTILPRLKELAYLNAGIKINYYDEKNNHKETFLYKGGLSEYLKELISGKNITKPIVINSDKVKLPDGQTGEVNISLAYTDIQGATELSFVNNIRTIDGGTHMSGYRNALTRVINELAKAKGYIKAKDSNYSGNVIRDGIVAIIYVKLSNPQFESQTKDKLGSTVATQLVSDALYSELKKYLEDNPKELTSILDRCKTLTRAIDEAKKTRDMILNGSKSNLDNGLLMGRLSNCTSRDPRERELYIVEGESAGGSAKQARDRSTQAILPLRGKVLNLEKSRDRLTDNKELKTMVSAFGCGVFDKFDIDNLRYHKIIIMTDKDVDGGHISSLVLTFILITMPELIKKGHVYIAVPPLYKIISNKKVHYLKTDNEKEALVRKLESENKKYTIQRYKGLGEMNPEELKQTAMDKSNRLIYRVKMSSLKKTQERISMLMGKDVEGRRNFIEKHRKNINLESLGE